MSDDGAYDLSCVFVLWLEPVGCGPRIFRITGCIRVEKIRASLVMNLDVWDSALWGSGRLRLCSLCVVFDYVVRLPISEILQ